MTSVRKSAAGAVVSATALLLVASCSSSSSSAGVGAGASSTPATSSTSSTPDTSSSSAAPTGAAALVPTAHVNLKVAGLRPGATPDAVAALKKQVDDFNAANSDITVTAVDYNWDATTFQAQLQSDQVPTVFTVPFTDARGLIAATQIADMTSYLKNEPYGDKFNTAVLVNGQDASGNIYAIPTAAYGVGLNYNRDLFKAAGLDPDKPPTTWDEVEADAKIITAKTGKPGFFQMTKSNTGGWQLTTDIYSRGGRVESEDGKKATINTPQAKDALTFLHNLKWVDNVMGSNVLFDWPGANANFAAGNGAMFTQGADVYTYLVQNTKIKPSMYGITTIPLTSDANAGVLGGGTVAVVKAKATDDEKKAAMRWIDYYYLSKLTNQDAAVRDAKQLVADKQPVGTPSLPIFTKEQLDQSNAWVAQYVTVPLAQMKGFTDNIFNQKLVNEPPAATQAVYAVLDTVVQKVLTDKNANIDDLLNKAQTAAQNAIDHPAAAK
jgi:ABC-type glycerol-3-phosphate transport system substrate-binding protein